MASAFMKGLGIGVLEGISESLETATKKFEDITGTTINYHLGQGKAEKLRHKKQQQETEEVLQRLASITGESDSDKAFNKAGEILSSLGGDLEQAKAVALQISKARSIDPNFKIDEAITYATNNDVPLKNRAAIIESFATGSKGMYTADVDPIKPEGLLGAIVGEKDVGARVQRQLKAIGIQPEDPEAVFTRPASARIDYSMIDPEGATAFQQARKQLELTTVNTQLAENRLEIGGATLARLEIENEDLPDKLKQEAKERAARITNLNTSNGIKQIEYDNAKKMGFRMHKAKLDRVHANTIRAKSGTDLESTQAYLIMESRVLENHITSLEEDGADVETINENKAKLRYTEKTIASLKQYSTDDSELTSKSSAIANYESLLERTADVILGEGGLTIKQIGDKIKYKVNGNPTQVYNVIMRVNKAFVDHYAGDPKALQYISGLMQSANPVIGLNNEIRNQVNKNPTNIPLANTVRTNDLELNKVYNLTGLKDVKGVPILEKRKGQFNFSVIENEEGKEIYNYPYAIWNGSRFIGLQDEAQGMLTREEETQTKDNN